ncbi:hypothetical protein MPSD_48850 [Mycobacterium pseudoshottsii JCM 15466]|nr:hypothetical protein MMSP_1407 [Mycobacterium sp. 012931]BBA90179.1 hypothetical protein MPSD_48850 [Mycobacterium pseudoshottsii JCM 15466]
MTSETVLVTGAFGQIGKRCTEILLRRGHTVVAMDLRGGSSAPSTAMKRWPPPHTWSINSQAPERPAGPSDPD